MSFKTRKQFRERFSNKRRPKRSSQSTEDQIKNFVIRNSRNGFFTKIKTISFKFNLSEEQIMAISGSLLADNILECVHDPRGEIKFCENGKKLDVHKKTHERLVEKKKEGNQNQNKNYTDKNENKNYNKKDNRNYNKKYENKNENKNYNKKYENKNQERR